MAYRMTFETHVHAIVNDNDEITGYELFNYGQLDTLLPTAILKISPGDHGWDLSQEDYDRLVDEASVVIEKVKEFVSTLKPEE